MTREERIYKLKNGSDTAIWAALEIERLESENHKLSQFVQKWSYDGNLQTFDSRELFRKEAEELLNV